MPYIDLGPVVGPKGDTGETGPQGLRGLQGFAGPNQITNLTETPFMGVLVGKDGFADVESIDDVPTQNSTGFATSGAVYTSLIPKANQSQLANYEETNVATTTYAIGDYVALYGNFYVVTSPIAVGETIANGQNCSRTTVADRLGRYTLLYTNSNSGQSFATQSISIPNMSGYDLLLIEYRVKSDGSVYDYAILPTRYLASVGPMHLFWASTSAITIGYRAYSAAVNAVTVGNGYRRGLTDSSATADDGYIVPVRIYGIKI